MSPAVAFIVTLPAVDVVVAPRRIDPLVAPVTRLTLLEPEMALFTLMAPFAPLLTDTVLPNELIPVPPTVTAPLPAAAELFVTDTAPEPDMLLAVMLPFVVSVNVTLVPPLNPVTDRSPLLAVRLAVVVCEIVVAVRDVAASIVIDPAVVLTFEAVREVPFAVSETLPLATTPFAVSEPLCVVTLYPLPVPVRVPTI